MNSRIIMLILSTVYALIGVLFLGWDVFFIVYLFWFENFIRILFYRLKINSISHVAIDHQIIPARDANGRLITELKTVFSGRLFLYFAYLVPIIIGLGLIFPMMLPDTDSSVNALVSVVSVIFFKDLDFNVALLLCIINEGVVYYRDFKVNKIYTEHRPYIAPKIFEKEDLILHVSIIFSAVFAFVIAHPSFEGFQNILTTASLIYIPGILLITLKFFAQLYDYKTKKEQEEAGVSLSSEKEDLMDRVKDL